MEVLIVRQRVVASLVFILTGCAGIPTIQNMSSIPTSKETIQLLENNSGATVKWQIEVSPAKTVVLPGSYSGSDRDGNRLYIVDPTPIVLKERIFVSSEGSLLSLEPTSGNVIRRYEVKEIFNADVVVDEYVDDPSGDVFSFAFNYELEKYVLYKGDSEVLVQRYGRGDSSQEFLDYHKGKLLVGSSFSGIFVLNTFSDGKIWSRPGRSMGKALQYQRLEAMRFDREREVICALFLAKKGNYFLEAYKFINGESLWKKDILTHFPGQKARTGIFLYKDKLVFTEGLADNNNQAVYPINKTFDILTGQEGPAFEGIYGMGWRDVEGSLYYIRYDRDKARWRGFVQDYAPGAGEPREMGIEGMDSAFGVKQVKDRFIYFSSQAGEMGSTVSPDDRDVHLSGYNGIGAADSNTLKAIWHVDLGRQKAMPTLYEKENVIVLGDPLGKGKTSDLAWLYDERLTDTGLVMDLQTGKVLWKAKIDGGRIARMTVWNNIAFIKTLSGNLFAVQWD
jgi:hypothetical protein